MSDLELLETEDSSGLYQGNKYGVNEEDLSNVLRIKSKVDITYQMIDIDKIIISEFKKVSRQDTLIGLSGVVEEWGVVSPIHVMTLEDPDSYLLLQGLRRIFGAVRSGMQKIPAMVWDFSDKQEGKQMAHVLSLMINRSQRFTPKEMWEQMKILEENGLSPGLIEYLLQMSPGDAMKLKDVMLSDAEYWEIRDNLMKNYVTIDAAYRKLCNERRKENRLAKEDALVIEGNEVSEDTISDEQRLSVDDVKELLDLVDKDVSDQDLESLDRSSEFMGRTVQDPKDRKPVDPKIKQAVFIRDGFKCRCCGIGGHSGWLGVLVYHHVIPVFLGGEDSVQNGICCCSNCHLNIHLYIFGKLSVDLTKLEENEKKIFKNIFKFGNIIIEAMKRVGMSKDQAYQADASSRRHLYPGEGLKENKEAFENFQKGGSLASV